MGKNAKKGLASKNNGNKKTCQEFSNDKPPFFFQELRILGLS